MYKRQGNIIPKIKISENAAKITTPHFKKVYRIFSRDTGKAEADLICLRDEEIDFTQPLELFDPSATWKRKVYTNIEAKELLVPIFLNGKRVYEVPELQVSRDVYKRQLLEILWEFRLDLQCIKFITAQVGLHLLPGHLRIPQADLPGDLLVVLDRRLLALYGCLLYTSRCV